MSLKMALKSVQSDITREVQWVIRNNPITSHFVNVYGHQDESVHFNKLSEIAKLNVIFDNKETQDLHEWITEGLKPTLWKPSYTWECWVDSVPIKGQVEKYTM